MHAVPSSLSFAFTMALSELRFFSPTIGKQVGAYVLLPDKGTPPYATFYLLHGLSDDYSIWLRRTRIEEYVKDLPLAVVMPDGFRAAYTNHDVGFAYADYMINDVMGTVERHFNVKRDRKARCIGGLSMGGYGALRLGLGFPNLFASVNSHSGALLWGSSPPAARSGAHPTEFQLVFGKSPRGTDHDLIALARHAQKKRKLPRIRIDCGTEDFLIEHNRSYVAKLKAMKIAHEYDEYPGAHDWNYWDTHVREAIAFHAKNLKLKV